MCFLICNWSISKNLRPLLPKGASAKSFWNLSLHDVFALKTYHRWESFPMESVVFKRRKLFLFLRRKNSSISRFLQWAHTEWLLALIIFPLIEIQLFDHFVICWFWHFCHKGITIEKIVLNKGQHELTYHHDKISQKWLMLKISLQQNLETNRNQSTDLFWQVFMLQTISKNHKLCQMLVNFN